MDDQLRSPDPYVRARAEWRAGLRLYPEPYPLVRWPELARLPGCNCLYCYMHAFRRLLLAAGYLT